MPTTWDNLTVTPAKGRDPSAQANGLGTQTPYRTGRPNGAR